MSQVISQGFRTMYEVLDVATIKPGAAGTMDNGNAYNASIKFLSRNILERMNDQVGLQEIETTLEFIIPCVSNDEAALVAEAIRKNRNNKTPFYIFGDLPTKYQNSTFPFVKSFDNGTEFLKKISVNQELKQNIKV